MHRSPAGEARSPMKKRGSEKEKKTLTWEDEKMKPEDEEGGKKEEEEPLMAQKEKEEREEREREESRMQKQLEPPRLLLVTPEDQLKERVAAFKSDPQLMDVATRFVNEVIERAKEEASKRMKDKKVEPLTVGAKGPFSKRPPWYRRAQGVVARVLTCICLCTAQQGKS